MKREIIIFQVVKVDMGRIMLCESTRLVLHRCFIILGLEPVERM